MTKKNKKHIVIATAIIILVVALLIYRYYIPDMKPKKQFTPAAVEYAYDDSVTSSQLAEYNARQDWQLTLVNNDTPICENCSVILTALDNGQAVDCRIYPQLQKMFDDMRDDGVYPVVASGYRTEQEQQQIYDESMAEYIEKGYSESDAKTETERWVAIPGTSEHQLGLGVDINADGINSYGYEVYNWLAQNAYRYGFIYRYPENKVAITGIANEPWHYRYVGVNAATEIYKRGICLEEYLGETN